MVIYLKAQKRQTEEMKEMIREQKVSIETLESEKVQHKITQNLLEAKTQEVELLREYKRKRESKDALLRACGGEEQAIRPLKSSNQ